MRQYSKNSIEKAQHLRNNATDAEKELWKYLRKSRLGGVKFRRQQPVGKRYIVDFVSCERKLIIELDGGQHNENVKMVYDKERDLFLKNEGYTVLRIWNSDIFENMDGVLEYIRENTPPPNPLPQGAGEPPIREGETAPPPSPRQIDHCPQGAGGLKVLLCCLMMLMSPAFAAGLYDQIEPASPLEIRTAPQNMVIAAPKRATLSHNDVQNHYTIAFDRFMQSNVKSAYTNFRALIDTIIPNDYAYMSIAENLADIGLFNLSGLAMSKISDKEITGVLSDDITRFYFPAKKLKREDEIYLGEIYSNIIYNDQSREATGELLKNITLLTDYDYANYVAALGLMKSGDIVGAEKYINIAISMNPQNINYKKLQAEIIAHGKKPQNALKIVEDIKSQRLYSADFSRKVDSLEQYILYKTKKNELQRMYHLGYYYYYEKEYNKAARTLQAALGGKKSINADVYALMARVYFDMNEFEKAQDTALKAQKLNGSNPITLLVLGDLRYRAKDYKEALKYYESANIKNSWVPSVKVAQTYQMLNKEKKAIEIYDKVLKTYSDAYLAYYHVGLNDKAKQIAYLKKAVSINMGFKDGWLDLGRAEIERRQFDVARKYLQIAYYIDENDFRYYYYQGLVYKNQGMKEDAASSFRRSLILNPDYVPAKEELSI
jgi:very-short-patch-repair endonuclease/uncharacterized protein HemY